MNRREQCLKGAIQIGDRLLKSVKYSEEGPYWESLSQTADLQPYWAVSSSIYSGIPGIALFLLELTRATGDARYQEMALASLDASYKMVSAQQSHALSYLTGQLSLCRVLLQAGQITGDSIWPDRALEIAAVYQDPDFVGPEDCDDMLNGKAGIILGLMYLHAGTGADWILAKIEQIFKTLLHRSWPGKRGLYWDRNDQHISGLCGFSHGSAGVGFVFAEMARYFANPALFELTRQAFAYETAVYDQEMGWPDLRKGVFSPRDLEEHRKHFEAGDLEWFKVGQFMNAWCHGAPGIALSRLRAWELSGETSCLEQARLALSHLNRVPLKRGTLTLCHGAFGDLDTYLEAWRVLKEPHWLENGLIDEAIHLALSKEPQPSGYMLLDHSLECPSMFMGISGIGYSLLRFAQPDAIASIISPYQDKMPPTTIDLKGLTTLALTKDQILAQLIGLYFQRTLNLLQQLKPTETAAFLQALPDGADFLQAFRAFMETNISPPDCDPRLVEIFQLEDLILTQDHKVPSHSLLRSRLNFHLEDLEKKGRLEDVALEDCLVLDEYITMTENNWNWLASEGEIGQALEEPEGIMIHLQSNEIQVTRVSYFTAEVLKAFAQPKRVAEGIRDLLEIFELEDPSEAEQVQALARRQIHEALKAGLLFFTR